MPDFPVNKAPEVDAVAGAQGLDAHSGCDPFMNIVEGKGLLYVPKGLVDGPLPTHYEPVESPVRNRLHRQGPNPVAKKFGGKRGGALVTEPDRRYPHVLTTYRLTEHHGSGVMSRWLPWLAELMPELFCEIDPDLALTLLIDTGDTVTVSTPRGQVKAKALVTPRIKPLEVDGKIIHVVGLPWHFGFKGLVTGGVVNDLSAMVGDPNVSIPESKAMVCNLTKP